ncbi:hypothetical protein NPIL_351591 [Nephila pilipes]|uniref:Uncharacterized protein n=1 Tax=Nephila pilipes TaxID=299642 RepID=A0A8X6R1Q5_NEPPI|nr:hypothetical protein NPIL_351591 [Nephila pilipes]
MNTAGKLPFPRRTFICASCKSSSWKTHVSRVDIQPFQYLLSFILVSNYPRRLSRGGSASQTGIQTLQLDTGGGCIWAPHCYWRSERRTGESTLHADDLRC